MIISSTTVEAHKLASSTSPKSCRIFSLAEILSATNGFDDELVIGEGGFGKVYKGRICIEEASQVVAIKRLDSMSNQGELEFRTEIEMLSKLRHSHLVSLIGFCDNNKEMILVYAYMPRGTLYDHLHKADIHLNWGKRLKIAIDAGHGLNYLHAGDGTLHGVIHRDVKSSNILLDENWAALISDFGLSKITPTNQSSSFVVASVKGTFGYLDPEFFYTGKLTRKTDVYAFGVVLLELLSGRLAVDRSRSEDQCSLVRWAQKCVKERKLDQLVDPYIKGMISPKCLRRFAQIAYRCLLSNPQKRPTMTEVVVSLQASLELQKNYDNPVQSLEIMGFTSKMHKYFRLPTKINLDHVGTSTSSGENIMTIVDDDDDHRETHPKFKKIPTQELKKFTYDEVKVAAMGFGYKTCLGEWRYGKVYKGWVDQKIYSPSELVIRLPVFIKIFQRDHLGSLEKSELDSMLTKSCHANLVEFIGYCLEGDVLFLVYEFMQNGNLEDCLHKGAVARLPLDTRVKMALGIARGLAFLHNKQDQTTSDLSWIHKICVFERCNILLDEDFTAKFWDYNVWKFRTWHDEKIDCYYHSGCRRPKSLFGRSNLTSFAVVLAEILIGEPVSGRNSYRNLSLQDFETRFGILKDLTSLGSLAKYCFEICNDEDSESSMLRALKKLYPSMIDALFI